MTTTHTKENKMPKPNLDHRDDCIQSREIEITNYPERGLSTHRCIDCGEHVAVRDDGTIKAPPTQPGPFNRDEELGIFDGITMEPAPIKGGAR